jgi:RHS repeat-associated protein
VLHYDPLGRLVRTEHPDGTLSRVEFDPWWQQTWDGNDTVRESRWYAERGSPDPQAEPEPALPERRAAWLAAGHAQTPAVAHLDPLGRSFLTVADAGTSGSVETRTELDIDGNTRSVTDARGVVVLRRQVDPAGRVLHTASPDAGERWTLPDVAGAPVRSWDGRGHALRYTYDLLRRPVGRWVRPPGAASERLARLTIYGETHLAAADRNLRGQPHLVFDGAGMVAAVRHDFKGNLLAARRHLARDHDPAPDWAPLAGLSLSEVESAAVPLLEEGPPFATATDFDALDRPVLSVLPDATVVLPRYNEAGLLESVSARLRDDPQETPFVVGLSYDAKGQRQRIDYGNGARTVYTYHPLTYRLVRLETLRGSHPERLQDLSYVYDPVGNIVEIRDGAQQTVFFAGQVVTPATRYTYDPLYRLVSATGREHASLGPQPDHRDPDLPPLPHPNDAQALRTYTQTYTYDPVGNILTMAHQAAGAGWTRHYDYATGSNRLLAHSLPTDPAGEFSATFSYDPHGNMTSMPHLATIDGEDAIGWDEADRMHTVDLGGGGTACYHYEGAGQRVRKVIKRLGGLVEERIYLGGYEVHRRRQNGTVSFERQTVHLMDDARRIALVETTTVDGGAPAGPPEVRIRYQLDNHLGSCSLELDQQAAVISYEEYHPYGSTSLWLAAPGTEVSDRRYRYTGMEKDEETGLYYHGARYYAPWLARWTATDPIGIRDGTNVYAYVRNNPVGLTDPSGRQGKKGNKGSLWEYVVSVAPVEQADPEVKAVLADMQLRAQIAKQSAATERKLIEDVRWYAQGTPTSTGDRPHVVSPPPESRASVVLSGVSDVALGGIVTAGGAGMVAAGAATSEVGVGVPVALVGAGAIAGGTALIGYGLTKIGLGTFGLVPPEQVAPLEEAESFTVSMASPTGQAFALTRISTQEVRRNAEV